MVESTPQRVGFGQLDKVNGMISEQPAPFKSIPDGFVWGATTAGIKASGNPDLALAVATLPATGAAMFTSNRVVAAPITVGRRHLQATGGRVRAVLVNSGNANCATGQPGFDGCVSTCVAVAETFGCIFDEVIPSSTGIIGVPFPADKVLAAVPALKVTVGGSQEHADGFAKAILTTDTKPKTASAAMDADGVQIHIWGAA